MTDLLMRRLLCASVAFNLGGAVLFAFPSSPLGALVGFPVAPVLYRAVAAMFVVLFAGAYGWLAMQPRIDRPLVGFAAIGKATFFGLTVALWLSGDGTGRVVLAAAGDLALAGAFASWLLAGDQAGS